MYKIPMKIRVEDIKDAFSSRNVIDLSESDAAFVELACSLVSLRDCDQLNVLPALMISLLEDESLGSVGNYADMIIATLVPQPKGWSNLIDSMIPCEVSAVLEWLKFVKRYPFAETCSNELERATDFYESRSINHN